MARPTVIRNEDILEAARAVFLERGILATSAEVAQRAGVSEGSLFKRFKTKADLFRAAMGFDHEDVPRAVASLGLRVGAATVDGNLVDVGLDAIGFFKRILPIIVMSWSNLKDSGCMPFGGEGEPPPLKVQRLIAEYLREEIALGRVREVDPVIIARAFMGAVSSYVFSELFMSKQGLPPIEPRAYVEGFVLTLWAGMRPQDAAADAPAARAGKGRAGVRPLAQ
jgi:AcrR family transcriptional regulator